MLKTIVRRNSIGYSSRVYEATLECGHVKSIWGQKAFSQKKAKCTECIEKSKTLVEILKDS